LAQHPERTQEPGSKADTDRVGRWTERVSGSDQKRVSGDRGTAMHRSSSWKNNWEELSTYFKYPEEIRRLITTTNPIESLNSQLRKVTNNKGVFNSEESLEKMIYIKIEKVLEKWGRVPIPNGSGMLSQLMIYFEDKNIDWKKLVS